MSHYNVAYEFDNTKSVRKNSQSNEMSYTYKGDDPDSRRDMSARDYLEGQSEVSTSSYHDHAFPDPRRKSRSSYDEEGFRSQPRPPRRGTSSSTRADTETGRYSPTMGSFQEIVLDETGYGGPEQRLEMIEIAEDELDGMSSGANVVGREPHREKMTEQQWIQVFTQFDDNNDGRLTHDQLESIIHKYGLMDYLDPLQSDLLRRAASSSRDGSISKRNFMTNVVANVSSPAKQKAVRISEEPPKPLGSRGTSHREDRGKLFRISSYLLPTREQDSYMDSYRCCPPPIVMIIISITQLVFFIINGVQLDSVGFFGPPPVPNKLAFVMRYRNEAWRYMTYMLLHAGVWHFIFNVGFQLILGIMLEMVHGPFRILLLYMSGVLAGSLFHSLFTTSNCLYLIGASGGVYAIIFGHVANLVINWTEMEYKLLRIILVACFVLVDIGSGFYRRYIVLYEGVSYAAHFGGACAGIIIGIMCLYNLRWRSWETVMWYICTAIVIVFLMLAILWNVFWSPFPLCFLSDRECCRS